MTTLALRHVEAKQEVAACFAVMRELRPHLVSAEEFVERVDRQRGAGYRLLAAWRGAAPVGLAGYRLQENLIHGRFVYIDDLVVAESERRGRVGAALLEAVAAEARALGCQRQTLDTANHKLLGPRLYFRNGMLPTGLHFRLALT
jgi:GNAT superfamily N-acetyltransferase